MVLSHPRPHSTDVASRWRLDLPMPRDALLEVRCAFVSHIEGLTDERSWRCPDDRPKWRLDRTTGQYVKTTNRRFPPRARQAVGVKLASSSPIQLPAIRNALDHLPPHRVLQSAQGSARQHTSLMQTAVRASDWAKRNWNIGHVAARGVLQHSAQYDGVRQRRHARQEARVVFGFLDRSSKLVSERGNWASQAPHRHDKTDGGGYEVFEVNEAFNEVMAHNRDYRKRMTNDFLSEKAIRTNAELDQYRTAKLGAIVAKRQEVEAHVRHKSSGGLRTASSSCSMQQQSLRTCGLTTTDVPN